MGICERRLQVLQEGGLRGHCSAALAHGHAPGGLRFKAPQRGGGWGAGRPSDMLGNPLEDLRMQRLPQQRLGPRRQGCAPCWL